MRARPIESEFFGVDWFGAGPYPSWTRSPYYWWYEYLKRVKGYGPKHPLYKDFGDLTGDFMEWWDNNAERLFAEPGISRVTGNRTKKELILTIPLTLTLRDATFQINRMLKREHYSFFYSQLLEKKKTRKGRKSPKKSKAKYPLYVTPVIHGLQKVLKVYDWKQEGLTHVEIARKLKILNDETEYSKRKARISVSRDLKHAKGYLKNVEKGVFPKK